MTCHVEDQAGDACLLCHNRHIGTFETARVPTKMANTGPIAPEPAAADGVESEAD